LRKIFTKTIDGRFLKTERKLNKSMVDLSGPSLKSGLKFMNDMGGCGNRG